MRVIGGSAKGMVLTSPKGNRIRPALDKVKGAIFNILNDIEGAVVLDLFAGTGSIGLEALSRGAAECLFVDSLGESLRLIEKNLKKCRLEARASSMRLKLPLELNRLPKHRFDLVFVDPPYDQRLVNPTLRRIVREKLLAPQGTVIVEHSPRERIAEDTGLELTTERKYGQTRVSFLK